MMDSEFETAMLRDAERLNRDFSRGILQTLINEMVKRQFAEYAARRERLAMHRLTAQPRCTQCNRPLTLAQMAGTSRVGYTCETCGGFAEWDETPPVAPQEQSQ